MRVWVDITHASQVVFFAPVVQRLEAAGHTVTLTARRFASAELLRRYGLVALLTGHHRGGDLATRAVGLVNRTAQLVGSAATGDFDVAAGSHASDFVLTAWALGVPRLTLLDDERPQAGNPVNMRLVDEVAVPECMPLETLAVLGAPPGKLFRYPGFKEEYYLYDVRPDPNVLQRLGVEERHVVGVVRPASPPRSGEAPSPAETALAALVDELARRPGVSLVLLARDGDQQRRFAALDAPGLIVPDNPVDGISLVAAADFLLGGGGAMAREAAALGTPAYRVSRREPSAVDAALLAQGRLRRAAAAEDIELVKKPRASDTLPALPRNPQLFVDEILALAARSPAPARLGRLVRDVRAYLSSPD